MSSDEESMNDVSLDRALHLAESDAWQERELAARVLARYSANQSAFEALIRMLDDRDTAVIEGSVASLATSGGKPGVAAVLERLAFADDNAGYHIRDKLVALWLDGVPILDLCREIVSSEPENSLSIAAREVIEDLTPD